MNPLKDFHMQKNSMTHQILLATKFYNKYITLADLKELNPNYPRMSSIARSLKRLENFKLIHMKDENTWIITELGRRFLVAFADLNKHKKTFTETK